MCGLLGVAVVGLGVGEQHARAYLDHPSCHLRWIYDIDPAAAARGRVKFGPASVATSFDEVLSDTRVDIVSIASYDDAHFGQVMAAIDAGKHVFVEKPLCRSFDELWRIKDTYERRGTLHLRSNLALRAAPLYGWLKRAIAEGDFGEVYAFDGDYLYGRVEKITDGWRKEVKNYSVMQGGGIHLVDLMLWLTGQRPASVAASGNRIVTSGTAFRYDDYVAATYRFPSGLVGRMTANFGCVHRHQHAVRVFGTKATFIYDDQGPRLHVSREPSVASTALALSGQPSSKGALVPEFVDAILKGADPHACAQREFDVISVCLAADAALSVNEIVSVEYV